MHMASIQQCLLCKRFQTQKEYGHKWVGCGEHGSTLPISTFFDNSRKKANKAYEDGTMQKDLAEAYKITEKGLFEIYFAVCPQCFYGHDLRGRLENVEKQLANLIGQKQ